MATVIYSKNASSAPRHASAVQGRLKDILPSQLYCEIERFLEGDGAYGGVEEIRLRSGRRAYVTLGGRERRNLLLDFVTDRTVLSDILERICDGSLYAYSESITRGYVSAGDGIRVGVCGRAAVEGGRILGIYDVSALNIRLPCRSARLDGAFLETVKECVRGGEGILLYSPPAGGKTTLLRALAHSLASSSEHFRVSLVDTKDELYVGGDERLSLDLLSGYPKAEGIRIATAFMNPQVIICDEIGDGEEAEAIAEAQNSGVPLIASTHGGSLRGLLKRSGMRRLYEARVFELFVRVGIGVRGGFELDIRKRGETVLEDSGSDIHLP